MLSNKFIGKWNLRNSTSCQALFNMGIIWKFQMIHCIIKKCVCKQINQDWNNLSLFYVYIIFFGSLAQLRQIMNAAPSSLDAQLVGRMISISFQRNYTVVFTKKRFPKGSFCLMLEWFFLWSLAYPINVQQLR